MDIYYHTKEKIDSDGFAIIENVFTPGEVTHLKSIYRPETIDWTKEREETCSVPKGGIMIMKPLLLHASGRTMNNLQRRVIHIEFSNRLLPGGLQWSEKSLEL